MNIQWYPGHMSKAKRMMLDDIKLIDVIIEILDARVPVSSKNPDIDNFAKNKSRVIILNKCDLADKNVTNEWKEYYTSKGYFVALVNSKSGAGVNSITGVIKEACKEKIERDRKRGIINRPVRAMIVGIPNVGKSTFINSYAKKACTKTGNRPGVTKGKQWIKLRSDVELLDTPGILWPKFEDQETGIRLALIGSINDEILNIEELAIILIKKLLSMYPDKVNEIFNITDENEDADKAKEPIDYLYLFATNRGCITKGAKPDLQKAARLLLDDYRNGKFGGITLDRPENQAD